MEGGEGGGGVGGSRNGAEGGAWRWVVAAALMAKGGAAQARAQGGAARDRKTAWEEQRACGRTLMASRASSSKMPSEGIGIASERK